MEVVLFLMYPAGFLGIVSMLFFYLRAQSGNRRSIAGRTARIIQSNLPPAEDIRQGFASVAASVKQLREAKQEEQALLHKNWDAQFYTPEEIAAQKAKEISAQQAKKDAELKERQAQNRALVASRKAAKHGGVFLGEVDTSYISPNPLGQVFTSTDTESKQALRTFRGAGSFVRKQPQSRAPYYGVAEANSSVTFDGWVYGEAINGNNVWFVRYGLNSGLPKYVWSGTTTQPLPVGLPDLNIYDNAGQIIVEGESWEDSIDKMVKKKKKQNRAWFDATHTL